MTESTRGRAGPVAWETLGEKAAPPILLVRPLGGGMNLWGPFAARLAQSLRVVLFDARGCAFSGGSARVSTEAMADDARAVLDALAIPRAHLFGISLGGMVAMRLALSSPDRVGRLVLASTAARGLAFERAGLARGLSFARCFTRGAEAEACLVRRVLSHAFHQQHPAEVERIAALVQSAPTAPAALLAHGLAAARHDARGALARLALPALVLNGDRDHLLGPVPREVGERLARRISGAVAEVISDAGHDLTLEQPEATAARVARFVQG